MTETESRFQADASTSKGDQFEVCQDASIPGDLPNPGKTGRGRPAAINPTPVTLEGGKKGYLVYIFAGDQNPAEIAVFRKICMKYGLQAWDEMGQYMPWRGRSAFRTTLCHVIKKQALSEYDGIRADPFEIAKDNNLEEVGEDYAMKGGVLVNQKWDRSAGERELMRKNNAAKYGISQEDADKIKVPIIISLDYMKQLAMNREQSLLLKRAALRREAMKRGLAHWDNLGVADLKLGRATNMNLPTPGEPLVQLDDLEGFVELLE